MGGREHAGPDLLRALLVDFGGVLTTNVFESFRAFCRDEGLDPDAFLNMFRSDPEAIADLRRVERGEVDEDEFAKRIGDRLGVKETDGLVDRLFARIDPDGALVDAVRRARGARIRSGLRSNSMGSARDDRDSFPELFDAVAISGEVVMHKPEP